MTSTTSASRKLNWGFLSTARINTALLEPLRRSKSSCLAAIASRSLQKAKTASAEWNIPRAYGSYEELLSDPEIDVIYNSLPNGLHAEWSIKAIEAGKHVLCEKPIAITLPEIDAMIETARSTGKVLAEAFMYLHHPQTTQLKEWVEAGEIGELLVIRGSFTFILSRPQDPRWDPALGGGSVWDVGCYPITLARYITGQEPVEVFGWQVTGHTGVDDIFTGQMRFPNGVLAQFDSGFRSPTRTEMDLVGTKGTLHIPDPFKAGRRSQVLLSRGSEVKKLFVRGQELYTGEVEDMANAVLYHQPPLISLDFSRGNVAAILALLASAKENQAVKL